MWCRSCFICLSGRKATGFSCCGTYNGDKRGETDDGGVSGPGVGAEHSDRLFAAAGNSPVVRVAFAAWMAAAVGRAGRRVRRGGVSAGDDTAGTSAVPAGDRVNYGAGRVSQAVETGGAVLPAGGRAGGPGAPGWPPAHRWGWRSGAITPT